ncbi:hypothetical protein V6N13_079724 [Hibiscus sabdariffa]
MLSDKADKFSDHDRWKTCLQFLSRLTSSPPSNPYKQTAQLSGGSPSTASSSNFITGRIPRIRRADTGGLLVVVRVEFSSQTVSVSRTSESPR